MEHHGQGWEFSSWSSKSRLTVIAVFTVLYLSVIQESSAIRCWVCSSDISRRDGHPDCRDPFDNRSFPITNCQDETPTEELTGLETAMCRKVRQKVDGNWTILRTCAWVIESDNDHDEGHDNNGSEADDIHEEYYHCMSKDGCNGADSAKPVFFLMILFPFLAITRNAL